MELAPALLAYAIPAALITMLPGPDTAMVLTTAVKGGRRAAVLAAAGVGTGILLWGAAAAGGLAAALRSSTVAYDAFRLTCAAYLVLLAVRAVRASLRKGDATDLPHATSGNATTPRTRRSRRLPYFGWGYRRALLTCLLNPKLGIFFVVVLPQFIPAGAPVGATSLALSSLHAIEATAWYLVLGKLADTARHVLARRRVRIWLDRATGTVYLGFGLRLVLDGG